jgi:outer membrane lipoprotein-sorting protein
MIIPLMLTAAVALQDPAAAVKAAIEKTRASSSYKVTFKSSAKVPKSDAVVTEGESVWVNPGVLFIHSKATGGKEQAIVRTGTEVQVYNEDVQDWVDSVSVGETSAARGVENPDVMLAMLAGHLEKAAWTPDKKGVHLAMQGDDIAKIASEQGDKSFDWANSSATVDLILDAGGRVASISCSSQLALKDPAMAGKTADYTASVSIVAYDKDRELKFELKGKPLDIPADLKAKIDAQLKKK